LLLLRDKSHIKPINLTIMESLSTVKLSCSYLYHHEWNEKFITLQQLAGWIQQGRYARRINAVRGLETVRTDIGMVSGYAAAEELPQVFPSKGMKGGYTGLMLLSFRIEEGQDALEQLRKHVNLWEQTLLSFIGSSGQSLKVLIPYRLTDGTLPTEPSRTALFHQYAYNRAAEYALNSTGIRPEEVIHNGNETFRISFDPQVFLNLQARPIRMEQPTEPLTEETAPVVNLTEKTSLDTQILPGYTRREMDVTKFNFICRQLAFKRYMELDEHLMRLAKECQKAGIDQELAVKLSLEYLDCFDKEVLLRSTFNTAYEKHRQGMMNPIENSLMHQQLLEDFLKRRYMFRRNRVTDEVEFQEKYHYRLWWKPLTQEAQNDIHNAAIREGIKVWHKDMERILLSEHITNYDPVRDWLERLPKWDGKDRLGAFADRVKTQTPAWKENFKIWMRSMVSQWRSGQNVMYGAQMVLMLVGGQGTRKSTFMRMILPRELMSFYIDRIDFANKKEALRALSRFLLINIDEYDQVSKAQTAFLKHLIQRTDVKERKLYTTMFEQQQRYAAFCATTNSLMPLKDESGSRRYLVVEVDGIIDTDTQGDKRINYPQLYAQIIEEIENGEEYAFTGEREQQITQQNAEYYETPDVISLFEDLFSKPKNGDEVLLLSPTGILRRIKDTCKVNVISQSNATLLGNYLHRNGFQKGKGENRRLYQIAQRT